MQTWRGKPYYSLDAFLHEQFQEKVYKVSLDGGFTCPNRDGTLDTRGCIFCSAGGSGEFAGDRRLSIGEQLDAQIESIRAKRPVRRFIAYFQAFTNTYAPAEQLDGLYREALARPEVAGLSVATPPRLPAASGAGPAGTAEPRKAGMGRTGAPDHPRKDRGVYPQRLFPLLFRESCKRAPLPGDWM